MPSQLTGMKLQIIKVVFLVIFFVFLATGIFSFIYKAELLESISLLLAPLSSLLTFITLQNNSSGSLFGKRISGRTIVISYLITFILFIFAAFASLLLTESSLITNNLLVCAFTQIISYQVFRKQSTNSF